MPRSPRATITQSAARMISTAFSTACGFSIFAISGIRVCLRTSEMSLGSRTNESATRSTPIDSPKRSSSRSLGDGRQPARGAGQVEALARGERAADLDRRVDLAVAGARSRAGGCGRRRGRRRRRSRRCVGQARPADADAVLVARLVAAAASVSVSPGRRSIRSSRSGPMRSFGPGRSCRIATWRPARLDASRTSADVVGVLLTGAVGEVEPRDVEPGVDHAGERLGVAARRADGGDDLGARTAVTLAGVSGNGDLDSCVETPPDKWVGRVAEAGGSWPT